MGDGWVGDVNTVRLLGLDGVTYVDRIDDDRTKPQHGDVTITAETNRVYLDTTGAVTIDATALSRRITISKTGSRSTVVWNPWIERARAKRLWGRRISAYGLHRDGQRGQRCDDNSTERRSLAGLTHRSK